MHTIEDRDREAHNLVDELVRIIKLKAVERRARKRVFCAVKDLLDRNTDHIFILQFARLPNFFLAARLKITMCEQKEEKRKYESSAQLINKRASRFVLRCSRIYT